MTVPWTHVNCGGDCAQVVVVVAASVGVLEFWTFSFVDVGYLFLGNTGISRGSQQGKEQEEE
jgi:hypothetical protein